jgi:hypothetical protein
MSWSFNYFNFLKMIFATGGTCGVFRASAWDQDFESESAAVAAPADKGRADKSDKTPKIKN